MRNLICLSILLLCSLQSMIGQPYYSRLTNEDGQFTYLHQLIMLPDDKMLISYNRNVNHHPDTSLNGIYSGWQVLSSDWTERDSFLFKENLVRPDARNILALKGDTVIQGFVRLNQDLYKEFHIYGSSLIQKDSLFHWRFSLDHVPGISIQWHQVLRLNRDGNIITGGYYIVPTGGKNHVHIYLYEIDMEGQVIHKNDAVRDFHTYESIHIRGIFDIKENADNYYVTILNTETDDDFFELICVDKEDLRIRWIRPSYNKSYSTHNYDPSIDFSLDSQYIYYSYRRSITDEEYDWEGDPEGENWPEFEVEDVMTVDAASGDEVHRISHFRSRKDSAYVEMLTGMTSRHNGDFYIGGRGWDNTRPDRPDWNEQYVMGLVARVDPQEEFKWIYRVIDYFGHKYRFGVYFHNMAEAENGDIVLIGFGHNQVIPPYRAAGWVVRLSPEGCSEGAYCSNDTISLHTFTSSISGAPLRGERTVFLRLAPNPVQAGALVRIETATDESPDIIRELRIIDMRGQVVHQQVDVSGMGVLIENQLRVPTHLSSGVYQIEMIASPSQRYQGRMVVE